jgi:hypothetical protein
MIFSEKINLSSWTRKNIAFSIYATVYTLLQPKFVSSLQPRI